MITSFINFWLLRDKTLKISDNSTYKVAENRYITTNHNAHLSRLISVVDVSTNFVGKTDILLNKLERFIWPIATSIDHDTATHYAYKAVPVSVKNNQVHDWAKLQLKTLSPFPDGDNYYFISRKGLHAWFAMSELTGVPETAGQNRLADGKQVVEVNNHFYQQVWCDGVLTECLRLPQSSYSEAQAVGSDQPWAIDRKLKQALLKPLTWLSIAGIAFILSLIYSSIATVTIQIQHNRYSSDTEVLQNELGEKLNTVTQLRQRQGALQSLTQWNLHDGSLPRTLSTAIEGVLLQTNWHAQSIVWQNKTLTLEIVTESIDIAELVNHLEQQIDISKVVIRPATQANTWTLELVSE